MKVLGIRWNELRKRYQKRGVVLVLGAGVSSGSNLPNWYELILRLANTVFPEDGRKKVSALIKKGYTLPAIAGLLDSQRGGRTMAQLTASALYRDFPFNSPANTGSKRDELIKFIHANNSTLRSIAAVCAIKRDNTYAPNPSIAAVVNCNFDPVLANYARARYREYLFRTIERADRANTLGRIPIYYMHGLVRYYPTQEAGGALPFVLTEQEYFDFFDRPNSVFNYTFLYLLREFPCLFVGLSMRDENIRRLLHYSTTERRRASGDSQPREGRPARTKLRHFAVLKCESPGIDEQTEISLRRLGTRVAWVKDYAEIPTRLADLYEQPGRSWADVY